MLKNGRAIIPEKKWAAGSPFKKSYSYKVVFLDGKELQPDVKSNVLSGAAMPIKIVATFPYPLK
ncbi:MAG: hypothetical protein BGO40_05325 [Chryseobacterium sp. 39-10]|nr:hypothetical protein [Chryseobacterium sp.]OJV47881.1 MAG: hypothetical protein BGO40_05325 [Chryseobacterium sp. 39-10]